MNTRANSRNRPRPVPPVGQPPVQTDEERERQRKIDESEARLTHVFTLLERLLVCIAIFGLVAILVINSSKVLPLIPQPVVFAIGTLLAVASYVLVALANISFFRAMVRPGTKKWLLPVVFFALMSIVGFILVTTGIYQAIQTANPPKEEKSAVPSKKYSPPAVLLNQGEAPKAKDGAEKNIQTPERPQQEVSVVSEASTKAATPGAPNQAAR